MHGYNKNWILFFKSLFFKGFKGREYLVNITFGLYNNFHD